MSATHPPTPTLLPIYRCLRCDHAWVPRTNRRPAVCPACKDPRWDRERSQPKKRKP